MDKVLLKYTEYSEPHESRTNTDILETLRRKGLDLDGSELDGEESMQVTAHKGDGMDLSVGRQRIYAPSMRSPEAQFLVAETSFPISSGPSTAPHRPPGFKSVSPASPHNSLMAPHSVFSHMSRGLDLKSPPPLHTPTLAMPGDADNQGPCATQNPMMSRGVLYQGLHSASSVVAMGKAGLLGHTLAGYGLSTPGASEYSQPGFYHSVSLQRGAVNSWQATQPPHQLHGAHLSEGMSTGGCSFPSQSCSSTLIHEPCLSVHIKSERSSPEYMTSPASSPLHNLRRDHSPMSGLTSACRTPTEAPQTQAKTAYLQKEEEGRMPLSQEMCEGWQR
ncbi:myocyte-specific enhancer factor 2B isoform X2 [Dunckerocampus dactyliophorus]|nr:myocyte-specific enhancer factor 2B isoform X2 [Dunckerocampus dactyliophorus]